MPAEGFQLAGALGPLETQVGKAAHVTLGSCALRDVSTVVAVHGAYNQGFPGDSILGVDLLAHFLVRLDYPRHRLWLRRRRDAPQLAFDADAYLDPTPAVAAEPAPELEAPPDLPPDPSPHAP